MSICQRFVCARESEVEDRDQESGLHNPTVCFCLEHGKSQAMPVRQDSGSGVRRQSTGPVHDHSTGMRSKTEVRTVQRSAVVRIDGLYAKWIAIVILTPRDHNLQLSSHRNLHAEEDGGSPQLGWATILMPVGRRRSSGHQLVFRDPIALPVPSRAVLLQAARGALAEGAVHAALHPLDGIVLRATLRAPGATSSVAAVTAPTIARVRLFCIPSVLCTAGGAALGAAAFALAYAALHDRLHAARSPRRAMAAAAIASVISTAVDAPLRASGAGARLGARTELRHALGTAARDVPADALEFGAYELFRGAASSPGVRCLAGALAGAISTLFVAPMDVSLARMIAAPGSSGLVATMRQVLRSNGGRAAFAGIAQRCLREALASALFFCVYEAGEGGDEEDGQLARRL